MPEWASWNPAAAERPWTVGAEEEVMLLDPREWTLAGRGGDVLQAVRGTAAAHASAETHSCVIELATRPHATAAAAAAELEEMRRALAGVLRFRSGLCAAVAGTHPFAAWPDVQISEGPRYRHIHASLRELAQREPTSALHVHVAVPDGEAAVRALDGLRAVLPTLLALSANSPFWQGRDSGLASARTAIFSAFPRTGTARHFGSYAAYVDAVDEMLRCGAVPDYNFLWWDARLQPRLGTVEVRIMDAQTRAGDTAALIALVQCLVALYAEGHGVPSRGTPETLAENRFLAARDGMRTELIDLDRLVMRPVQEHLVSLLGECLPVARELGCIAELGAAARLAADPGDARQRALAGRLGLRGLVEALAGEFVGDACRSDRHARPPRGPHAIGATQRH